MQEQQVRHPTLNIQPMWQSTVSNTLGFGKKCHHLVWCSTMLCQCEWQRDLQSLPQWYSKNTKWSKCKTFGTWRPLNCILITRWSAAIKVQIICTLKHCPSAFQTQCSALRFILHYPYQRILITQWSVQAVLFLKMPALQPFWWQSIAFALCNIFSVAFGSRWDHNADRTIISDRKQFSGRTQLSDHTLLSGRTQHSDCTLHSDHSQVSDGTFLSDRLHFFRIVPISFGSHISFGSFTFLSDRTRHIYAPLANLLHRHEDSAGQVTMSFAFCRPIASRVSKVREVNISSSKLAKQIRSSAFERQSSIPPWRVCASLELTCQQLT